MTKRDRWETDDVLGSFRKREYLVREVREGMTLTHTGSRFTGTVVEIAVNARAVLTIPDAPVGVILQRCWSHAAVDS